jgi:hypothetical protein
MSFSHQIAFCEDRLFLGDLQDLALDALVALHFLSEHSHPSVYPHARFGLLSSSSQFVTWFEPQNYEIERGF